MRKKMEIDSSMQAFFVSNLISNGIVRHYFFSSLFYLRFPLLLLLSTYTSPPISPSARARLLSSRPKLFFMSGLVKGHISTKE